MKRSPCGLRVAFGVLGAPVWMFMSCWKGVKVYTECVLVCGSESSRGWLDGPVKHKSVGSSKFAWYPARSGAGWSEEPVHPKK